MEYIASCVTGKGAKTRTSRDVAPNFYMADGSVGPDHLVHKDARRHRRIRRQPTRLSPLPTSFVRRNMQLIDEKVAFLCREREVQAAYLVAADAPRHGNGHGHGHGHGAAARAPGANNIGPDDKV